MKKMLSILVVYFMVIGFIVRNFIFTIGLEIKNVICYIKEKVIFVVKKLCVIILKMYASGAISSAATLLSGIYVVLSLTGGSYILGVCMLLKRIGTMLTMLNGVIYIALLTCV